MKERGVLFPTTETLLNKAFATNDLRVICKAIDAAATTFGNTRVARDANIDRKTLYRAFRIYNGPALNTMVNVLRVLGLTLTVIAKDDQIRFQAMNKSSTMAPDSQTAKTARILTKCFERNDLHFVIKTFAETLASQENMSEFARRTIISRETLYRSFSFPHIPRFSTALSVLNALGLQFALESHRRKSKLLDVG